jgi:hypothetical protein
MAFIKFNKSSTKAAATSTAAKTDNTVYFPTDEKAIYLNGQKYGENLGLTQTPAQVQTLLDRVDGGIPYIHCSTNRDVADKVLPADTKMTEGGLIAVGFYDGNTVKTCNLVVGTSKWKIQYTDGSSWNTPNFNDGAIVTFLIKGTKAYVVSGVMQAIDDIPTLNSTNLISSGGVYEYTPRKLFLDLTEYFYWSDENDIQSETFNLSSVEDDPSYLLGRWYNMIFNYCDITLYTWLESTSENLFFKNVVVKIEEDDTYNFTFRFNNRDITLTFYVPSDDPGGGS